MPESRQRGTSSELRYGSWPSPLSAGDLTRGAVGLREPGSDGSRLLWIESRPEDSGRCVLVRADGDARIDLTPPPFNVRSRVHEYGGGAWTASGDLVMFSNYADGRLYRIDTARPEPRPITPEGAWRFADLTLDEQTGRLLAVREDHTNPEREAVAAIVLLDPAGPNDDGGTVLVRGADFYANPRPSPAGDALLWLEWFHPNMPWDGTHLRVATLTAGGIGDPRTIAGGGAISIAQPRWLRDGTIVFVSDESGWWNPWLWSPTEAPRQIVALDAEFATPAWIFGVSNWDRIDDETLLVSWTGGGMWSLGTLDIASGALRAFDLPFVTISDVRVVGNDRAVMIAASADHEGAIHELDLTAGTTCIVRESKTVRLDPAFVSPAEPVSWPTPDGATAHGFLYRPVNPAAQAPAGALPPLIVESHGGPTAAASASLDLGYQYWTTRGFAILDVDYGGSTGHGRAYRERLKGQWGIVDVDDCIAGALAMAERGIVDRDRLIIRGGSAGGYTTLAALAFRDVFRIGVSSYGIGNLETLATDMHKFESRYLDSLVGPYPAEKSRYVARSPIHYVDRITSAMLILQGLDDKVVPPDQSIAMADAVRARGFPIALLLFEGEGHGFRRAETVVRALEAEESFYAQVLGFTPAGDIPPVAVENMPISR